MPRLVRFALTLACALVLAAPATAQPQQQQGTGKLYRYVDDKGRVHYLDRPPTEAAGRPLDQLNRQGATVRPGEKPLTPEQLAEREAEKRRAQEEAIRMREEARKNQALLDTYSTEKDIDEARARALANANEAIRESRQRLGEALKRQEKLKAEAEFYEKRPMPQQLKQEMQNNEREIAIQRENIEKKEGEITALNAKYDSDKRRYQEITKAAPKTAAPVAAQPVSAHPAAASKR
ncbi:MAG: hypothetical protein N2544_07480 [Burkholderiales bacterium]|nr:hypothetical protein [Burkholderiales bacterium]